MILRAGQQEFSFPRPALVMGILNVTPDSFSDGGRFLDSALAIEQAFNLVEAGAEIVDVGGESTRPGAVPVSESEELRRIGPVLEALAGKLPALISVDTYKAGVAREALKMGAGMVNDVGAQGENPLMWQAVAEAGAAYVAMHIQGTPQTMQQNPIYEDLIGEVGKFFEERLNRLSASGVKREQVVLDVGIGFGKQRAHNLELLAHLREYRPLGRPLMIGVSRKSFLARGAGGAVEERLPAGLACSCWGVGQGANIVRTHDVEATLQAIRMTEEIAARAGTGLG